MKTSELQGSALNLAVAKCEGYKYEVKDGVVVTGGSVVDDEDGLVYDETYEPSTDWSCGGAIIEREKIAVFPSQHCTEGWEAARTPVFSIGPTLLIAAMRCYVMSRCGEGGWK